VTTFLQLQDEILQTLHGFGLSQPRATFLTASIDADDLAISVTDASNCEQGLVEIEGEAIFIESVDRNTNTLTVSPDGRGYYGTTAAAHDADVRCTIAPTWPRHRVKSAINDVIAATYPTLWGVAQTSFTYNPSVTTYALPAEAERILAVTAQVNGPSLEPQTISHYSLNSVAPTDDWATTNIISLHEAVTPGREVTVTYLKQPSALSGDSDAITVSGLRETAKLAIVYGACAQLVSFMDVSRLPVDVAVADEYDEKVQVGMASRISGQLQLRYEMELEKERKRLRATTPVKISVRKR
jgi:hypothetical protein